MSDRETQPLPPDPPVRLCVRCGAVMEVMWQPGYEEVSGYWLVSCERRNCALFGYSLSNNIYPPKNLAIYVKTGLLRLGRKNAKGGT